MQYRIEEKPAFRVVGKMEEVNMINGENFIRIPKMWEEFPRERCMTLEKEYADGQYPGMFGLIDMPAGRQDVLIYGICVSSGREELADWMTARDVPAVTYAIFDTSFAAIQDTTRRIFAEWLPNSDYNHAEAPELEYYPDGDMSDDTKYMCEIWIPVVKK